MYIPLANFHQHCDKYLKHPTNLPKPHLLLSLHSSFIPNWKHCSSTNPILIHPILPTSIPVSTPNTIHHSCLTVCLPDSLDLTRCLSILFWKAPMNKLVPMSHDFAFVGAIEISSLRLRCGTWDPSGCDFKFSHISKAWLICVKRLSTYFPMMTLTLALTLIDPHDSEPANHAAIW